MSHNPRSRSHPNLVALTGDILDARVFVDVIQELLDIKVRTQELRD